LRERARSTAIEIGERLLVETRQPAFEDVNFEHFASQHMNGSVGYALAFLALATATGDARFEQAMHAQLKRAAEVPGRSAGLFDGVSGVRAVAQLATAIEPRYRGFVQRCDALVESIVPAQISKPVWYNEYDVFFGRSGIRLARSLSGLPGPDHLTAYLEWLIEDDERWISGYAPQPEEPAKHWLGVAHGIAGVLSTLAITLPEISPQLGEKMSRSARYLASLARNAGGGLAWPRAAEDPANELCRAAWCVGAAGIAVALLQVARRVADADLEVFARDVLMQVSSRPSSALLLGGQGLCHGTMGNAAIFFAAARQTGEPAFERACEGLTLETLDGLAAAEGRSVSMGIDGVPYDALGEPNGIAGIALALLTMIGEFDASWLRCHALAPQ
jgi:lantibiotic biosynthesis protein